MDEKTWIQEAKDSASPRDWPEDFGADNGQYTGICMVCRHEFIGMKDRVVCNLCSNRHKEYDPPGE